MKTTKTTKVNKWEECPPFESSNVSKARYNATTGVLEITFYGGGYRYNSYRYNRVPASLWDEFKAADSKGLFVNMRLTGPDRKNPIFRGERIL